LRSKTGFPKSIIVLSGVFLFLVLLALFLMALRGTISVPAVLQLGSFSLHLYSIFILAGVLIGAALFSRYKKNHKQLKKIDTDEALIWVVLPGVIFARAWYVIIFWGSYSDNLFRAFALWEGGLSIYGAVAGGVLGAFFYCRRKKIDFVRTLELAFIFIPLAQIIGRFGNFVNQEHYGPQTSLPWGTYIRETGQFHHPAFLYEQLGNLLVFLFLFSYYRSRKLEGNGMLIALYLLLYGIVRFLVDLFRTDTRVLGPFTIAQLLSIIMAAAATVYILVLRYRRDHARKS
jgi:prolipoprotein diacylglyceryl transferase